MLILTAIVACLAGAPPAKVDEPMNRLARETSPYLLQHARNPVDWHPWGEEAFAEARRRDVPIFLSIGYSTCYWCHVMERESFENEGTAELLRERVVSIKVDREERPDVDDLFMTACQVFTQLTEGRSSGGWPLTVFIDPHTLKPFFVGTYYPPEPAFGRPSFTELVAALSEAWRTRRGDVATQAERLAELVGEQLAAPAPQRALTAETVKRTIAMLMQAADHQHGGFGGAPKFPQPSYLLFLLHTQAGNENETIRRFLDETATAMAMGGLFDQVGGGFHRYCVDATWTVPHFEKMLYDNGQLASIYALLIERTSDGVDRLAMTLRRSGEYLLREMRTAEGLFCSAQDAEVDAREGGSFLWQAGEVREVLRRAGREDLWVVAEALYGLDRAPNFRDPHHPDEPPAWVLRLPEAPAAIAGRLGFSVEALSRQRGEVDALLKAARDLRPQPLTDDKVITAWNGLAIAGLADAGRVLREPAFVQAAARAADGVLATMRDDDGGLLRIRREGVSRIPAFLEDYALLAWGLLALDRAETPESPETPGTPVPPGPPEPPGTRGDRVESSAGSLDARRRVRQAIELVEAAVLRFEDPQGAFFDTLAGQSDLFVRTRGIEDGAVPSGNSMLLLVLLELHARTGEARWLDLASRSLAALSGRIADHPSASTLSVLAIDRLAASHPHRLPSADDDEPAEAPTITLSAEPPEVVLGTVEEGPVEVRFDVVISLPAGVHINAHEPGDPALVGLRLELLDGEGLAITADYPSGEEYTPGGVPGAVVTRVHRGVVRVPVRLARLTSGLGFGGGSGGGHPALLVTLQPCTDRACMAPVRRVVPLTIRTE
jgi:hypothetical protein